MGEMNLGPLAYLVGIGTSIVAGLVPALVSTLPVSLILLVAGLVVGFMNVTKEESNRFLLALIFLPVGAAALALVPAVGAMIGPVLNNLIVFTVPAGAVVAVNVIREVADR